MDSSVSKILTFNKDLTSQAQQAKYKAMQETSFRFYRGTCHLFYDHLATMGEPKDTTKAWICGDLHLENFGSFKGDNRLVYFDLNDFDEAVLAPVSWEVLRFAAAILIAADDFKYTAAKAKEITLAALQRYSAAIIRSRALMLEREVATGLMKEFFDHLSQKNRDAFMNRVTRAKGKKLKIVINPIRNSPLTEARHKMLMSWWRKEFSETPVLKDMKIKDCAHRIAGTGSLGCERYMIAVSNKKKGKNYLLDMKEAMSASLKPYLDIPQPAWKHEAERVITVQKRLQYCSPALLRPVFFNNKWFVLKELQPLDDKMDFIKCRGRINKLEDVILPMADLAAYAHLRGTGRQGASTADDLAREVSGADWHKHMLSIAEKLASQMKKDYTQFRKYKA